MTDANKWLISIAQCVCFFCLISLSFDCVPYSRTYRLHGQITCWLFVREPEKKNCTQNFYNIFTKFLMLKEVCLWLVERACDHFCWLAMRIFLVESLENSFRRIFELSLLCAHIHWPYMFRSVHYIMVRRLYRHVYVKVCVNITTCIKFITSIQKINHNKIRIQCNSVSYVQPIKYTIQPTERPIDRSIETFHSISICFKCFDGIAKDIFTCYYNTWNRDVPISWYSDADSIQMAQHLKLYWIRLIYFTSIFCTVFAWWNTNNTFAHFEVSMERVAIIFDRWKWIFVQQRNRKKKNNEQKKLSWIVLTHFKWLDNFRYLIIDTKWTANQTSFSVKSIIF